MENEMGRHASCVREKGNAYKILLGKSDEGTNRKEDLDVSWRIILQQT
jgi:hypothetical protein